MGVCLNFEKGLALYILRILIITQAINGVSIWEPFCCEEKLFQPYVRVFQKGRHGVILRDRGPGFIDLEGLSDIYVCTNGLVMMYYSKTLAMGEVYEHGELHWTPHHCELYNPSASSGVPGDLPKKCLLSILLIGHPKDYRLPALQMFVAPLFEREYGRYVNATSLIMIGNDGECLVEKGAERARLRIRLDRPAVLDEIDRLNQEAADEDPPRELQTYPSMFCQLDVQRKLGQSGIINLVPPNGTHVPFTSDLKDHLAGTIFYYPDKDYKREVGSATAPRYKASKSSPYGVSAVDSMKELAEVADQVYAALLSDRKMHFVGCLRYPEFSLEHAQIIYEKLNSSYPNVPKYDDPAIEFRDITPNSTVPFWADSVKVKWRTDNESRFVTYEVENIETDTWAASLKDAEQEVVAAQLALDVEKADQKQNPPVDAAAAKDNKDKITELEHTLLGEQISLSLWPYKAAYNEIYLYVQELLKNIKTVGQALVGELLTDPSLQNVTEPYGLELKESITKRIDEIAERKLKIGTELSRTKFKRRYEPYNPQLVQEYDLLLANYTQLSTVLKLKTQQYGPKISHLETLQARFKVYRGLLNKAYDELVNAIKSTEKNGNPAKPYVAGHPFDRTFADTMIEIGDAVNPVDGAPFPEDHPDYNSAKACHLFTTAKETCSSIKPHPDRANKLFINRKGKGEDWKEEDQWRGRVLTLIEEIFRKVCPYVSEEFPTAINNIVKGYLMGDPAGTGLHSPIIGSRLESIDHNYQGIVYNSTYAKMAPNNWTDPPSANWLPPIGLNPKSPFWDHIIDALEHCEENATPMEFWHNEEDDKPLYITYRKYFANNNTQVDYDVEELFMLEKADEEYAFNWAIDMNWKIAATVLGICMPSYETKIPLISARFYALYSQDFLSPLRQIWMSNRDNPVLKVILGRYYSSCVADNWARNCMEASYVESGDRFYRPPRYLYVNAFTEMNYFITGPMSGSGGILTDIENGNFYGFSFCPLGEECAG